MVLNITTFGDNPSVPFSGAETYIPDQLIAGDEKLVTQTVTLAAGQNLKRGTVLGMITTDTGLAGTPVAASGNIGNGVISAIHLYEDARPGIYTIEFNGATTFNVIDPLGAPLVLASPGEYGPDADVREIGFTFTAGGTAMSSGDIIQIVAAPTAAGVYTLSRALNRDGSEMPCAVLVDDANASAGAVTCGVYLKGEFNGNALIFDTSWTLPQLTALLRRWSIFVKSPVSMDDPTTSSGGAMGGDAGGTMP